MGPLSYLFPFFFSGKGKKSKSSSNWARGVCAEFGKSWKGFDIFVAEVYINSACTGGGIGIRASFRS